MKEIHAMTGKEIANYRENMRRIEALSKYPVPPGLLNMEDLGRPMSEKEIARVRDDIRRINEMQFDKKKPARPVNRGEKSAEDTFVEMSILGLFFTIGSIASGDLILLPLGLLLLIPAFLRICKRLKRK